MNVGWKHVAAGTDLTRIASPLSVFSCGVVYTLYPFILNLCPVRSRVSCNKIISCFSVLLCAISDAFLLLAPAMFQLRMFSMMKMVCSVEGLCYKLEMSKA